MLRARTLLNNIPSNENGAFFRAMIILNHMSLNSVIKLSLSNIERILIINQQFLNELALKVRTLLDNMSLAKKCVLRAMY